MGRPSSAGLSFFAGPRLGMASGKLRLFHGVLVGHGLVDGPGHEDKLDGAIAAQRHFASFRRSGDSRRQGARRCTKGFEVPGTGIACRTASVSASGKDHSRLVVCFSLNRDPVKASRCAAGVSTNYNSIGRTS